MCRNRILLLAIAATVLFGAASLNAQISTQVAVCGRVDAFVPASATTTGSIILSGKPLVISIGTQLTNQSAVTLGANVCLNAAANALGQVAPPASVTANLEAELTLCGIVDSYTAATAATTGVLRIAGRAFTIAAGTVLENDTLLVAGADVCVRATVNGLGHIVAPGRAAANVQSAVSVCGTIEAYVAATSTADGTLKIAGRTFTIASGTSIANASLIQAGVELCLDATLNGAGQIVAPASVTAAATSTVTLCGRVDAYVAATASSAGSITIGGRTLAIASGTNIAGAASIVAGAHICLQATLDVSGRAIHPTSVAANARVRICGHVSVYTAATANSNGTITIDGKTYTIAAGTIIQNAAAIQAGLRICINATVNIRDEIIPPSEVEDNRPPSLTVPGAQTTRAGETLRFTVSAADPDQGDAVQIAADSLPPHATFTTQPGNPARGEVVFTPDSSQAGHTFTARFTARDGHGADDRGEVTITVQQASPQGNQPPRLAVPGEQTATVGETLRFTVSATDPDPDTVRITASNVPSGAVFTPQDGNPAHGELRFTPTHDQRGRSFIVTFVADDRNGHTPSDSVVIRVIAPGGSANRPPILSLPGPQLVAPHDTLTFRVVGRDPEGSPVTLSAGPLPPNATFDPNTGLFRMTPDDDQLGNHVVCDFYAADPEGEKTGGTVPITVVQRRDDKPPILSVPPSPIRVLVGDPLSFPVVGTPQMPDCAVTLGVRNLPEHASFDVASGIFQFVPVQAQANEVFHVEFSATDCADRTTRRIITIIVVPRGHDDDDENPPGEACLGIEEIVFSAGDDHACSIVTVTLTNRGRGRLTLRSVALDHPAFVINNDWPGAIVLPSGMSLHLEIRHLGDPKGNAVSGTLVIETDDPTSPTQTLRVRKPYAKRRSTT
jgi:hypothetical protein